MLILVALPLRNKTDNFGVYPQAMLSGVQHLNVIKMISPLNIMIQKRMKAYYIVVAMMTFRYKGARNQSQ